MENRIPRKFHKIIAEVLLDTNVDKKGDIVHITKNEYNEYISFNTRTKRDSLALVSHLRNSNLFEIIEIG